MHKYMGGGHRGWLVLIHLFAYRDSNNENKLYWYLVFCAQWSVINLISSIKLQIFSLSVGEKSTKPSINFYIYQPSIYTIADKLKCFKKKKAILKLCCSFFHIPWPFYLWRQKISTCRDLEHFSFKKKIFRKKKFFFRTCSLLCCNAGISAFFRDKSQWYTRGIHSGICGSTCWLRE